MTLVQMQAAAQRVLDTMPAPFRAAAQGIVLQVVDWPPDDLLDEMGIDDRLELTGLYDGVPLTEKSSFDQPMQPDLIWLFRQPILAEWRDRGDVALADLVAHVTVHELAHHLGWSDGDIATVDRWWE
ncbi:MAG: metallopeptidase family protein [Roseivivax sp.]|nr:metallopeptidase family protein [Roseivivax sp.]